MDDSGAVLLDDDPNDVDLTPLRPSRRWLALTLPLLALSLLDISWGSGDWRVSAHVTLVSVALLVCIWLPSVLQLLMRQGGTFTAAGMTLTLERYRQMGSQRNATQGISARAADDTAARLKGLEEQYETLRRRMPSGFQRTAALESVLAEARVMAPEAHDQLAARLARYANDRDGARVVTLALLQGVPSPLPPQSAEVLSRAFGTSHSAFEEYHQLRTVRDRLPDFPEPDRQTLVRRVRRLLDDGRFPPGDRRKLAERITQSGR